MEIVSQKLDKPSNLKVLATMIKEDNPVDKIPYKTKDGKEFYTVETLIRVHEDYYNTTTSKSKSFFRSTGAQNKYRKVYDLSSDLAVDHIISQAVFIDILRYDDSMYPASYSYDWWGSIKVGFNQCWNLMPLDSKLNSMKGLQQEAVLCNYLQAENWEAIKSSKPVMDLCRLIRQTIVDGAKNRRIWNYLPQVTNRINLFFEKVGLQEISLWNPVGNPDKSCSCKICTYTREASCRWKTKYFILFQSNPKNKNDLIAQVNSKMLQLIVRNAFQSNVPSTVDAVLLLCDNYQILSPSDLFQSSDQIPELTLPQRRKL